MKFDNVRKEVIKSVSLMKNGDRAKRDNVAELAGVSGATVSFVFSKKRYVSPELVDKVMAAAKELDYHPDMVAASLRQKSTNAIAVMTDDIISPLQMEIIKAIQEEAIDHGYFVQICGGKKRLDAYVHHFISRRVDGIFLSITTDNVTANLYIKKLLNHNISVLVTAARGFYDDRICGVELDFNKGVKIILEYLKSQGHQKIAYVSCFDESYDADRRLPAFYQYMREFFGNNAAVVEKGEAPHESSIETGYALTNRLMARTQDITAIVCSNDLMAMGAIRALKEKGIDVPRDISVVGMDDIPFAKAYFPSLTTISHCCSEYGKRTFEILKDNIEDKTKVRREIIIPELVIRESSGPCKTS